MKPIHFWIGFFVFHGIKINGFDYFCRMKQQEDNLKEVISHAKEYGFVFPSSEIYDGLSATYDYGQLGVELKNNIKNYWWKAMVHMHENIVGIDAAIFMHPTTWKASGHVDAFNDPLIDNKDSKKRYRADVLIEEHIEKIRKKIDKEVEKGRKRFGDAFDTQQFLATNPNVLRNKAKIEDILDRLKMAINDESLGHMKYYKDKLDYFLGRQSAYIEKKHDDLFCERFGIQDPDRK